MKKVLLARPNSFIVKEMKRLVSDCGYLATPLGDLDELSEHDASEVGGVVISTALVSSVTADYGEVARVTLEKFPGVPVMLATLASYESIRPALELKFEQIGIDHELRSMSSAGASEQFSAAEEMLVIQKSDISDEHLYSSTRQTVNRFFR